MIAANGLTCAKLFEILKPFRKYRDGLSSAKKETLLKKAQSLGLVGDKTPDPVEPPCASDQRWIPLRDRTETVVEWALVDEVDYEKVMKFSWSVFEKNGKKYAMNNVRQFMHALLLGKCDGNDVVDHINSDGLDNTRKNLRFASRSLNSQNKKKKEGTSSKYYGVASSPWGWVARHSSDGLGYYDSEEKAAYAYDIHVIKKFGGLGKINGLEKPQGFVPYKKRILTCESRGVKEVNKSYYAIYWDKKTKLHIPLGNYKTEKGASDVYEQYRKTVEDRQEEEWLKTPIKRNDEGIAIIPVKNGKKGEVFAFVDDKLWHHLMKRKWHLDNNGYVCALRCRMHSEVVKVPKGQVVDHIYSKLDNRESCLRKATYGQNGHNRQSKTKAGYKGVKIGKSAYEVRISMEGKQVFVGSYKVKEIAAYAFNCIAKHLYGVHAKLNPIPKPEGWKWDQYALRLVQIT